MSGSSRGRIDKRLAVVEAARRVFAREGYARAGIEAIAAEAAVSTRTVYNHFDGKAALFAHVIEESSTQLADHIVTEIQARLDAPDDIEQALIALGCAWVRAGEEFSDHAALTRQLSAEAEHLPAELLSAWNEAGPARAERELARALELLASRGPLDLDDPSLAAVHFILLTVGAVAHASESRVNELSAEDTERVVSGGVRTFLRGHLPRSGDVGERAIPSAATKP